MNKVEQLSKITELFYLGGVCDVAMMRCENDKTEVNYYLADIAFLTNLTFFSNPFEKDVNLPIYDLNTLSRILKLMSSEEGEVQVDIGKKKTNMNNTTPHSIVFKSGNIDTEFVLGDEKIVNNEKKVDIDKIPYGIEFELTEQHKEQFFKYSGVLKDYDHFTINSKNQCLEINFGNILRSHENSITVSLDVETPSSFKETMFFPTGVFSNILRMNTDTNKIIMRVSKQAYVMKIEHDQYEVLYVNASKKNKT